MLSAECNPDQILGAADRVQRTGNDEFGVPGIWVTWSKFDRFILVRRSEGEVRFSRAFGTRRCPAGVPGDKSTGLLSIVPPEQGLGRIPSAITIDRRTL